MEAAKAKEMEDLEGLNWVEDARREAQLQNKPGVGEKAAPMGLKQIGRTLGPGRQPKPPRARSQVPLWRLERSLRQGLRLVKTGAAKPRRVRSTMSRK